MKKLIRGIQYSLTTALDALAPRTLPAREQPLHLTVVFHTEKIAHAAVFEPFLEFVAWLNRETQSRPTACVTTPHCPEAAEMMAAHGVSEREYAARLMRLADLADIGYHGHFYTRSGRGLEPMSPDAFDETAVAGQMDRELAWLRKHCREVDTYCAGWWLLNEAIARLLDERGIGIDSSLRRGHPNTFGSRYLTDDDMPPRGEPFLLPPSRSIVEIQSAFYPVDHPRRTRELLRPTIEHAPDKALLLALPSHEGETMEAGRAFRDNVRMLTNLGNCVKWTSLREQAAIARAALGLSQPAVITDD